MNKTILMGNLTRDPELRVTPTGKAVVQFSVAVNRKSSADREEVLFMDCEAWEKRAEAIAKFFTKGRQILVEGHLRREEWEDKNGGGKRHRIKLVVEAFHFTRDGERGQGVARTTESGQRTTDNGPQAGDIDEDVPF